HHPAVKEVQEIQERLTDQSEKAEVHDRGFVVLKFRETRVEFWTRVDLEAEGAALPGLQDKPGHSHRALQALQVWAVRPLEIEGPSPSFDYLRVQRCDNGGEKLVRHRGPLRAVYLVLEHRLRSALLDSHQRIILRSKPAHVSRFRCAVQAPDQAGV